MIHLSLNLVLLYKCLGKSQNSLISFAHLKFCKSSFLCPYNLALLMFDKLSEGQRQALNIVREGHNLFITGQGGTARKNNCLLLSFFPAGEGGFGQMMYRSLERSAQDPRDGTFLDSAQASFSWPSVDLARLLRRAYSRSVWIIFFEFVKVCGIRFSIWESFIGFYICCYPISTILEYLFSLGVRISWKKLC